MKIIHLIAVLLLFTGLTEAQTPNPSDTLPEAASSRQDTLAKDSFYNMPGILPYNPDKKVTVRMEMGTSFGIGGGSAGTYGVYLAPHISYKVSPKFRVNFGAILQNSNYLNFYSPYNPYYPEYTQTFNSNITRTLLYAEGQYMVNPRLMVSTKVYKEIATFGEPQVNPRALDLNGGGAAVGFQYKINDSMQIGAEISYNKGRTPYNPFYPAGIGGSSISHPYGIDRNNFFYNNSGW
ncbi:MAG: hypothetical protein K9H16_00745 [Bacteroidales bacterium]|nr:hypothetical protein [Bacteroidales bacterium]